MLSSASPVKANNTENKNQDESTFDILLCVPIPEGGPFTIKNSCGNLDLSRFEVMVCRHLMVLFDLDLFDQWTFL